MNIKENLNDEMDEMKDNLYTYVSKLFKKDNVNDIFEKDLIDDNTLIRISNDFFKFNENNILCENTLIDLEVFEGSGNDKNNTIFNYLNTTKTLLTI